MRNLNLAALVNHCYWLGGGERGRGSSVICTESPLSIPRAVLPRVTREFPRSKFFSPSTSSGWNERCSIHTMRGNRRFARFQTYTFGRTCNNAKWTTRVESSYDIEVTVCRGNSCRSIDICHAHQRSINRCFRRGVWQRRAADPTEAEEAQSEAPG